MGPNAFFEEVAKKFGGGSSGFKKPDWKGDLQRGKWAKKYLAILPLPREQGDKQKIVIWLHTGYIFLHTLLHTSRYSTCKNICYTYAHSHQGAFKYTVCAVRMGMYTCVWIKCTGTTKCICAYVHIHTGRQPTTSHLCLPLCTKPTPPTLKHRYALPSPPLPQPALKQVPPV